MSDRRSSKYDRSHYGSSAGRSGRSSRSGKSNQEGREYRHYDPFFDEMKIPEKSERESRLRRGDNKKEGRHSSRNATSSSFSRTDKYSRENYRNQEEGKDNSSLLQQGKAKMAGLAAGVKERVAATDSDFRANQREEQQSFSSFPSNNPYGSSPRQGYNDSQRHDFSRRSVERNVASVRPLPWYQQTRFRIIGLIVAALLVVGAIAAALYIFEIEKNLHDGLDENLRAALVKTDMAKEPFYILLLGTDGSVDRDNDPEFGGMFRSDSIMLGRVDPINKKVALISISRDIEVDLGEHGMQKLNSAYGFGGPALAVQAVSKLAGVPISHYAQMDFDGFQSMVDALDGIEVEVPIDIDDWEAGGSLKAGLQVLDGEAALILCRSRNAYADLAAHPDEMRTANQRMVLSAIARKVLASDVVTIASSVQAMSEFVKTDLAVTDIIGLAQIMRGLNSETDMYTASMPTRSEYVNGGWYEVVKKDEWNMMVQRLKEGKPPAESSVIDEVTGTIMSTAGESPNLSSDKYATITIKNATNIQGQAAKTRSRLVEKGFKNVIVGEMSDASEYPETLIVYDKKGRAHEAEEIASIIGQGRPMLNDGTYLFDNSDIYVVIGNDWDQSKA